MRLSLVRLLPWLMIAGCASPAPTAPAAHAPSAPPAPTPPAAAQSAPAGAAPDINAEFRKPDLDVPAWVARFEGESREIAVHRDQLAATLDLHPGEAVADIGAGTGLFEEPFAKAVGTSGTVYAVDISPAFIDHIKERAAASGWTQVHTVLCDDHDTKLPPASVDAAFICDTYHHFEHPADTLASLRRAMRPGGRLVVVDFDRVPGRSRDWILQHVRCGKEQVRAEIEAAGFRNTGAVAMSALAENYVLIFEAPAAQSAQAAAMASPVAAGPAVDPALLEGKTGAQLDALAASADPAVRLAVIRACLGKAHAAIGSTPGGPAETPAAAAGDEGTGGGPPTPARAAFLRVWGRALTQVIIASNPSFEADAWTSSDEDIANAFAAFIALAPDAPHVAFARGHDADNSANADRVRAWLDRQNADPHVAAYLKLSDADGPWFPEIVEGGDPLPTGQTMMMDGVELHYGNAPHGPDSAPRGFVQQVRDGHVVCTAYFEHAQFDTTSLQMQSDEPNGVVLRIGAQHAAEIHVDPTGRPDYYFVER